MFLLPQFLITIFVEYCIIYLFLLLSKSQNKEKWQDLRVVLTVVSVHLITHTIGYVLFIQTGQWILLEMLVVLVEALVYFLLFPQRRLVWWVGVSFIANLGSILVGFAV